MKVKDEDKDNDMAKNLKERKNQFKLRNIEKAERQKERKKRKDNNLRERKENKGEDKK